MKNILIVSAAVALLLLGWFLLFDAGTPDTDRAGGIEAGASGAREKPGGEDQRADRANRSDREAVKSPESKPDPRTNRSEAEEPADPSLGALDLKVVYAKGRRPAPFVRVLLLRRAMAWDAQEAHRTGSDGRVLIENLRPGSVYVKALRGGENQFSVFAGRVKRGVLAIPSGVGVAVEVVDADGAPVAGAKVWLSERWRENRGEIAGETDRDGKAELEHVSPHCNLAVRCRGFEPSHLHRIGAAVGSTVQIRITLKRGGGMVEGIVVDERGDPVKKAFILIGAERLDYSHRKTDGSWSPGAPPITRVSDKDGRFSADATPLGKLVLQVRHPDFAPHRGEVETLPGAPVSHRVVLLPGAGLFGKVTDSGGEPVSFARVSVGAPGSFAGRTEFASEFGEYEIRGLAAGEQKARAAKGTADAEHNIHPVVGERVEWNAVLDQTSVADGKKVLVGRVVDHRDEPLHRWRVAARASAQVGDTFSAKTDTAGRFRLVVESDELRVWTHAPGEYAGFPALIRDGVRVDGGELILRVDAAALRVGDIKGVVIDSAGQPVRAQIQTWHHEKSMWREFKTDAKTGEFHVENVPPGQLDLKVTSADHAWQKLPVQTIAAGQSIELGRIVMESGGRIEGTLRLVGGRSPKKVKIGIYYEKGGEAGVAEYADGKFRSGVLAAGKYTFFAMGDRFASLEVDFTVAAGLTMTKNFRLQPAAIRTLKFVVPVGVNRPRNMTVNVRSKKGKLVGYFGLDSSAELRGEVSVLPGEYVVSVWGPGTVSWLSAPLKVEGFADTDPITYTIRPPR